MRIRQASITITRSATSMTPMIDIVFLLLVFFVMTFQMSKSEGDFNIKMPGTPRDPLPRQTDAPLLRLRLTADPTGQLAGIALNGEQFATMDDLHDTIVQTFEGPSGPAGGVMPEIEFQCDYHLQYNHVVEAMTAVSGCEVNGEVTTLLDKIRFAPPSG